MAKTAKGKWQDRLIEVKPMRVGDILPHPLNPKHHPMSQTEPLTGLLNQVGKADVLKAYKSQRNGGKLTLWDGHGRQDLNPDEVWQVAVYDMTDDEADLMLASFDEIGFLAQKDRARQDELLQSVEAEDAALDAMLEAQRAEIEMLDSLGSDGRANGGRKLTNAHPTVTVVVACPDLRVVEGAIMATGRRNRGEALAEICRDYLNAKGQLDFLTEGELEAITA